MAPSQALILRLATRSARLRQHLATRRAVFARPRRSFSVLGIETSADDTCVALLDIHKPIHGAYRINANAVIRKVSCPNHIHKGIHPTDAVVSHTQHLSQMVSEVINSDHGQYILSKSPKNLDLISVTRGPGMGGCLSVGVTTAKALADVWDVPIIGVHHMQAHALTPWMSQAMRVGTYGAEFPTGELISDQTPRLTLLVSGKHTMLVYSKSLVHQRILASAESTIALGAVLDKIARELVPKESIPSQATTVCYPLLMEELVGSNVFDQYKAPVSRENEINGFSPSQTQYDWTIFPPLRESKELRYVYSGFLGTILDILRQRPDMPTKERQVLAFNTMRIGFEHLMSRVFLALDQDEELKRNPPKLLVLSGGVASNKFFAQVARRTLKARGHDGIRVLVPPAKWCTDNAAMIAWAGYRMYEAGWQTDNTFTPMTKWSIEEILTGVDCWTRRPGFASIAPEAVQSEQPQQSADPTSDVPDPDPTPELVASLDATIDQIIQGAEAYLKQYDTDSGDVFEAKDPAKSVSIGSSAASDPANLSKPSAGPFGHQFLQVRPPQLPAVAEATGPSARTSKPVREAPTPPPPPPPPVPSRKTEGPQAKTGAGATKAPTPPVPSRKIEVVPPAKTGAGAPTPRPQLPHTETLQPETGKATTKAAAPVTVNPAVASVPRLPRFPAAHPKDDPNVEPRGPVPTPQTVYNGLWAQIPSEAERHAVKVRYLGYKEVAEPAPVSLTGRITGVLGGWVRGK